MQHAMDDMQHAACTTRIATCLTCDGARAAHESAQHSRAHKLANERPGLMRRRRLRSAPQLILPFVLDASKLNVSDPNVRARSVAAFAAEASAFHPPARPPDLQFWSGQSHSRRRYSRFTPSPRSRWEIGWARWVGRCGRSVPNLQVGAGYRAGGRADRYGGHPAVLMWYAPPPASPHLASPRRTRSRRRSDECRLMHVASFMSSVARRLLHVAC
jgi:hypothetical protein